MNGKTQKRDEEMTTQKRIEQIRGAMELIIEAQALVDGAVANTDIEGNYGAYGRYGFDQLLGNGNPYDDSLNSLIDTFENE